MTMNAPPPNVSGGAQVIGVLVQGPTGNIQVVTAGQAPLLSAPSTTFQAQTTTNLQIKRAALTALAILVLAAVAVLGAYVLGIQPVKNWLDPVLEKFSAGMPQFPKDVVQQQSCTGASFLLPIDRQGMTMPTAAQATPGTILQISDAVEWATRFGGEKNQDATKLIASLSALMPEQETLDWVTALEKSLLESLTTGCFKFPLLSDVPAKLATEKSVVPPAAVMPAGEHFNFPTAPVGVVGPTATPEPTATKTVLESQQETIAGACKANSKNADLCQIIGTNLLVAGSGLDAAVKEAVASTSSETCYELVSDPTDWVALTDPVGKVRIAMARQKASFLQVWGDASGYHAVSEKDGNGVYKVCVPNLVGVPTSVPDGRQWATGNGAVVSDYSFLPLGQTWLGGAVSFSGPGPEWEFNSGKYSWVCGEDGVCVFPVYNGQILPPTVDTPLPPGQVDWGPQFQYLSTPEPGNIKRITFFDLPEVMRQEKLSTVISSECVNGKPLGWPDRVVFNQLPFYEVDFSVLQVTFAADCSGFDTVEEQFAVTLGNQPPSHGDWPNWLCTLEVCYRPFVFQP